MGLKIASLSKLACCLALILTPTVKSQTPSCNIHEINIALCLNPSDGSFSIDHSCCKMLNQAVQIGYSCLCLLAAASFPLPIPPLTLRLSNCSLSVPPLTLCQVIAPFSGGLTPSSPAEIIQTPPPPTDLPLPPLPNAREVRDHLNATGDRNNSPAEETQPPSSGGVVVPKLHLPNRRNPNGTANSGTRRCMITKTTLWGKIWFLICLFLVVLIHVH